MNDSEGTGPSTLGVLKGILVPTIRFLQFASQLCDTGLPNLSNRMWLMVEKGFITRYRPGRAELVARASGSARLHREAHFYHGVLEFGPADGASAVGSVEDCLEDCHRAATDFVSLPWGGRGRGHGGGILLL